MTESKIREFNNIIKDISNNETVQMMKDFNHMQRATWETQFGEDLREKINN